MARFLVLAFGLLWVGAGTAHAQAFKPRGSGKPAASTPAKTSSTGDDSDDTKPAKKATAKKATPKKAVAKKAPAKTDDDDDASSDDADDKPVKTSAKKSSSSTRTASKARGNKKTSRAARDGRPDDLTPDPSDKHDPDYVVITDDDEIE